MSALLPCWPSTSTRKHENYLYDYTYNRIDDDDCEYL